MNTTDISSFTTDDSSFQQFDFDLRESVKASPSVDPKSAQGAPKQRLYRGARGIPATITKATARAIKADLAATDRDGRFLFSRAEVERMHGASADTVEKIERGETHRDVVMSAEQEERLCQRHQRKAATSRKGEKHPQAKISDDNAIIAVGLHLLRRESQTAVAEAFGIRRQHVSNLIHRKVRPDIMECLDAIRADPEALQVFKGRLDAVVIL